MRRRSRGCCYSCCYSCCYCYRYSSAVHELSSFYRYSVAAAVARCLLPKRLSSLIIHDQTLFPLLLG